jgi:hypothetical protein
MKNGLILPVTAAFIVSSALLAGIGYAEGFHGHHHGTSATGLCIAVMSSSQKANLKQTFGTDRETWKNDRQNVATAKQALVSAILSGSKDVGSQESALATAQQQLQKDTDSKAQQVCGQLSSTQLSAAKTLFSNLTTLHANMRAESKSYFQQAKAASGDSQSQTSE